MSNRINQSNDTLVNKIRIDKKKFISSNFNFKIKFFKLINFMISC